jgi:hypothetical protein
MRRALTMKLVRLLRADLDRIKEALEEKEERDTREMMTDVYMTRKLIDRVDKAFNIWLEEEE